MEERALRQDRAVFADQVVPGKHEVGRRFALPRVGIEVPADQLSRLRFHQHAAVVALADCLVARRKVGQDRRPGRRMSDRRRLRHPEILTDFCCDHEFRKFPAAEQQILPKRHFLPGKSDPFYPIARRRKVPEFIKLAVVRDVALRHNAQ